MRVGREKFGSLSKKLSPLSMFFKLQKLHSPERRTSEGAQDFVVNFTVSYANSAHRVGSRFDLRIASQRFHPHLLDQPVDRAMAWRLNEARTRARIHSNRTGWRPRLRAR
ncbi:MAG TPA: hypothetical protein VH934_17370 [Xanthobacteraceae bacterium]|jgi:hypothetical protein